ncbi:thioredoxin family protein [Mucilaginibacter sp.]
MNFETYKQKFLEILTSPAPEKPYDDADYINYTRLNWSRQERWFKTGVLNPELVAAIQNINKKQSWTVITEHWCGDAAHTLPFINMLVKYNPLIAIDYQLRDDEPFLIDQYLTRGGKAIPKLIIAQEGDIVAVWGPRPIGCQLLYDKLSEMHVDYAQKKIALQKWYNEDKGVSFQAELLAIILKSVNKPSI